MPKNAPEKLISDPAFRKKLGEELWQFANAAEKQKGSFNERAQEDEAFYRNQPDESGIKVTDESEPSHLNIVQPRIDAITTKVCNPMTSNRPYFAGISIGVDATRNKECEDVVQFFLDNAQFPKKIRLATRIACMAAPAIIRVPYYAPGVAEDYGLLPGPAIEVIHPNDFFPYPLIMGDIASMRMVCHRRPGGVRVREIVERQLSGEYFDDIPIKDSDDDPQAEESGRSMAWSLTAESSDIQEPEDKPIEVLEGLVKYDLDGTGRQTWWVFTLARKAKVLLTFAPYQVQFEGGETVPLSRPWYFQHYVKPPMYGEFFCANSPARDLNDIQGYYNDFMTLEMEGSKMTAFPTIFRKGGSTDERVTKYGAGEIHDVPTGTEFEILKVDYDPSMTPHILATLERLADATVRISQAGLASPQKSSVGGDRATATEVQVTAQSMDEGADEYRDNAAMSGEQISDFIRELVFLHYYELQEFYGESLPCSDLANLAGPIRWEAQGKTAQSMPYITIQQLQQLLALMPQILPLIQIDPQGFITGIKPKGIVKQILAKMALTIPEEEIYQHIDMLTAMQNGMLDPSMMGGQTPASQAA